uniref:Uncharacterized protein n=1 Tax=Kalanchoe fedtschenkoi TaxID=63787 RepID=A0A7N0V4B1_KALFE
MSRSLLRQASCRFLAADRPRAVALDAFKPFNKEKSAEKSHGQNNESSRSDTKESQKNGGSKKEDKEGSSQRKQRRSWSQDLHRRFLHSL